jgi:hypothetical protein
MNFQRLIGASTCVIAVTGGASAAVLFQDNYSSFASGNLAGQGAYAQIGTNSTNPMQVSGGQVVIPGGTVAYQDVIRNFDYTFADGNSLFVATLLTVHGAPSFDANSGNGSAYFLSPRMGGFENGRIIAKTTQNDPTKYLLGLRATGQSANPIVFGTQELTFGQTYAVILAIDLVAGASNDIFSLYVDPVSSRPASTVYVSQVNAGTDPANPFQGVRLAQFASATIPRADVRFNNLVLTNDFSDAVAAVPEPATLVALGAGALALIRRRKKA